MDASLETTKNQILEIDQQIEKESHHMAQRSQAKHDETQGKIDREKGLSEECKRRLAEIMMERRDMGLEKDRLNERRAPLKKIFQETGK